MKSLLSTFALVVALLLSGLAFAPNVLGQTVSDNVSVQAGVVRPSSGNVVASGAAEVQKTLGTPKLLLDSTFTLTDNVGTSTGQSVGNTTVLRGYLGKNFFVAGGASTGTVVNNGVNNDFFLNPTLQTGVTFNATERLRFEPYLQLDTPDLLSTNPSRALTANLTTNVAANNKFGFIFDVGISQVRNDNRFLQSGGRNVPYASGGLYFSF